MLIIADPQGNLEAAAREGHTIQEELQADTRRLRIDSRHHRVGRAYVKTALSQYDVLHYAGHADYDLQEPARGGWRLADGKLTAQDILQLGQAAPLPALVFCNACQSGQTQAWTMHQAAEQGIYGLANAFLLAGAQHYIGSFWELPDQPGATFAIAFYRALAQGVGVGEALRRARQALAERHGEDSVVWASYVLYGDPTVRYLEAVSETPLLDAATPLPESAARSEGRRPGWRNTWLRLGGGALLACAVLLAILVTARWRTTVLPHASLLTTAYEELERGDRHRADTLFQQLTAVAEPRPQSHGYAGLAAVAFASGDYQRALDLAAQAEALDPEIAYSHVIRGHVWLNQGKTAEATTAYRTAVEKSHALPWQQAVAYDRLGRLYAAAGKTTRALEYYDKAISQHRDLAAVHADKAHLLEQLGKRQEALALYRQALQLNPHDALTAMLLREAERREQLTQDQAQQQRIDQLVDELVRAYKEDGRPAPTGDDWTSRPLTLAFLDFQQQGGPTGRAGEAEFIVLAMGHALRASGRLTIVEREVLDKVLAELKLNVSDIVATQTGLRKGHLLAAHLLAVGRLSQVGPAGLLSMRLIETETTRVSTSIAQFIEPPADMVQTVEQASQNLLREIQHTYPLQGRITRVTSPESVILNIGAQHGVTAGLVLEVLAPEESQESNDQGVYTVVGRLEVTTVEARACRSRVVDQAGPFAPGNKVREVIAP
jgi:tetratricopeptide (TPR) repeat protein